MAFASFDSRRASAPMAEINMVPLIDVMLVLLVIFIITAPLLTHTVKLDLPKADAVPTSDARGQVAIAISIDAGGNLFWDNEPVDRPEAARRFREAAVREPQPELHLRADRAVAYQYVARTLADASQAGLSRIGFISIEEDR